MIEPFAQDPLGWLSLEQIDRDLYRGVNEARPGDRPHIYGGQVAAQALLAASFTVAPDRHPHSLHGYFLRPGDLDKPIIFQVERDRDGRSFSSRRVAALQNGEVIFDLSCSFHVPEDGAEYSIAKRDGITSPDSIDRSILSDKHPCCDIRLPETHDLAEGVYNVSLDAMWCRVVAPFASSPAMDACLITFMSDFGSGFGALDVPGIPMFGSSIDHSMWFHAPADTSDWLLFDCHALKVGGHRGVYFGAVHTQDGQLAAMFTQEMLLRP